jgi:hypothetical protein
VWVVWALVWVVAVGRVCVSKVLILDYFLDYYFGEG